MFPPANSTNQVVAVVVVIVVVVVMHTEVTVLHTKAIVKIGVHELSHLQEVDHRPLVQC